MLRRGYIWAGEDIFGVRQRPRIVSHVRASNREEQRCKSQITIQTTLATKREQLNCPGQDSTVTLLTQSSG